MSLAELKAEVPRLSNTELNELATCVQLARKARDPHWLERVCRINAAMDEGRAHSQDAVIGLHERLQQEGH